MIIHLIDGTYELFRHFYGLRRFTKGKDRPYGAVVGVLQSVLQLIENGDTYLGVATDHVIESFRNRLWVDYKTAISLHAVIVANPNQHRFERLKSPTPKDNRITFGCINVPAAFYKNVVSPAFKGTSGIVYILPEKLPLAKILPGFHSQHAEAAPQQAAAEVAAADAEQDHGASDVAAADVAANAEADHATSEVAAADVAPAAEPVHATSDAAAADVAASDLAASDADRAATEAAADHGPALRPYQPLPVAAEAQPEPAPAEAAPDSGPALRPYQPLPAAPGADPDQPIPTAAADSAPAPR